mmetsp:Transcript_29386/g.87140  ORF Transcript_29386/g.87140 Transcript_29386/m.87140 type:complete len:513 (-) Transcript_29386:407-1945(-)
MQLLSSAVLLLLGAAAAAAAAAEERDLAVAGITPNDMGAGNCLGEGDLQYEKGEMSYGAGGSLDDCIAKCPSVHLIGVEDDSTNSKCNCLYPEAETPSASVVTFDNADAAGTGTGHVKSADGTAGITCYKSTRPPDTHLQFLGSPDLTLAGGTHTVRIPYSRAVGWDFDVKYYEVYDDEGTPKCNFSTSVAAEIDPTDGGYLDAAVEEDVNDLDPVGTYPRQNVTVKIDFNQPQEATFCVRTKLVDPFMSSLAFSYDEHIVTVKLTTDNVFALEGEGVGLEANAANEATEDFLYTLTAFECPNGYDPMAEGENNTVGQDGQIKLCIRTSDAEVELVPDSVNINVYQGDINYSPILGMTDGNANNFLITREGAELTAADDAEGENGYQTTRYLIQTVEQNFDQDGNGDVPNMYLNGTSDIDFVGSIRRLKAKIVFDDSGRKLAKAAEDVPFNVAAKMPKERGTFDNDLQKGKDDSKWHSNSNTKVVQNTYSSATTKGFGCALAIFGAALALVF